MYMPIMYASLAAVYMYYTWDSLLKLIAQVYHLLPVLP